MIADKTRAADKARWTALLVGIQLAALPFYPRVPLIVALLCLVFTLWAAAAIRGNAKPPGRKQRAALLALVLLTTLLSYGTVFGRDAGCGFLVLLVFLKLFETRTKRDMYVLVYLQYFIVAGVFFHTQSPWVALYVFAMTVYLTSLLVLLNDHSRALDLRRRLALSGRMMLQSLPLMLILFVLFPRVPGPLWSLPEDAATATTGLDDTMSPGSISSLIISDAVAFRVRFADITPAHAELYWRGPVLDVYNGKTWSAHPSTAVAMPDLSPAADAAGRVRYTVTLEPHQRDWLFALDYPIRVRGARHRVTREARLLNHQKVTGVTQYSVTSDRAAVDRSLNPLERARNLALPPAINPRATALARQWREQAADNDRRVTRLALRYFNRQAFEYTLSPPLLPGAHAMDDFLFQTRSGFCEHYASAFVYLMRAAGIPARVVTGYQGGEENPLDDYTIVRQSSAHAWAELWYDDAGWTRVDPTAAVSPDRVNIGIQNAVAERDRLPDILVSQAGLINALRYQWDSVYQQWNEWVIGFDVDKQRWLLSRLGFVKPDWRDIVAALVVLALLGGAATAWWVLRHGGGRRADPAVQAYHRFCAKLAKAGAGRASAEGPSEYLARVAGRLRPTAAAAAGEITALYIGQRYGKTPSESVARALVKKARQFKAEMRQDRGDT